MDLGGPNVVKYKIGRLFHQIQKTKTIPTHDYPYFRK